MTNVILDTGVLGSICHASVRPGTIAIQDWVVSLEEHGHVLVIPELADYELRRRLLRVNRLAALSTLDQLNVDLRYIPLTTSVMRLAADLWAMSRRRGQITAHDHALDGDVILAAQVLALENQGERRVVATTNVRHLTWFVDARTWDTIDPAALS